MDEAERAMRETFDLSEGKAALLREIITSQRGLIERAPNEADVYIGIPFCTTRMRFTARFPRARSETDAWWSPTSRRWGTNAKRRAR